MSRVEILERDVKKLTPSELAAFRSWFIEFDAAEWDRQIEVDSQTGKVDKLAKSAIKEHPTHLSISRKPANTDRFV